MIRRLKRDKEEERRVESIIGVDKLDTIEGTIRNKFVEVAINSSRLEKLKENCELDIKKIRREKPKEGKDLIDTHLGTSKEYDRVIKEFKEKGEDLRSGLEKITALKESLKRKEVIYYMDDRRENIIEQVDSRLKEIEKWIDAAKETSKFY